jgi:hypothetical protein
VRTGIAESRASVLVIMMGDGSDDPQTLLAMYRLVMAEGFDVVSASRYVRGGGQVGAPRLKSWLSRLGGCSLHALGVLPIHDPTNAFKMYRREVLAALPIESTGGFEFSLELMVKAVGRGFRVTEVPSRWRGRTSGMSKFRLLHWLPKYLGWYLRGVWALGVWRRQTRTARSRQERSLAETAQEMSVR